MVCIICYSIYNPGYISDAQFHRYKKTVTVTVSFQNQIHIHTNAYLHTITSNLRVHTITYASFTFTHAIQNDDIDMNMNMNMTPIDPRFLPLLIRVTIWYDTIRYIRVSSICNPSFFSPPPVQYDTSPDLFVLLQCYTKFKSIINFTTCIHTHTRHWYDDVI